MSLTIREALKINGLKQAVVVAGHQGLDNQIQFVNIMEVPEVVHWMKGGELLVTAGFAFKDDPILRKTLIYNLARKKVAAFGIKPGQYLNEVPQDMIEYADDVGLPLIELPRKLPYMEFMLPIFETLISNQLCQLKRSEEIHTRLLEVILSGGGFSSICQSLSDLVGNPVVLLDKSGNNITGTLGLYNEQCFSASELTENWTQIIKELSSFYPNRSHRLDLNINDTVQGSVLVPIQTNNVINGFLLVLESQKHLDEQDLRAIEYAGTIAALEFTKEKAVFDAERQVRGELLEDLITGSFKFEEVVIRRASFLNFNLKEKLVVFIIDIDSFERYFINEADRNEEHIQELKAQIFQFAQEAFQDYPGGVMMQMKSDSIVGLVRLAVADDDSALRTKCRKICEQVEKKYSKIRISIGVGRAYLGVRNIKKSHEEAKTALRVGRFMTGGASVTFFQELGAYRFLYELKESGSMQTFHQEILGKLKLYDAQNRTDLFNTLVSYFKNDCNLRRTAEKMFIHKNSVIYRIKKVEEITGLNLNDSEDRFNLQLSIKLDQLVVS